MGSRLPHRLRSSVRAIRRLAKRIRREQKKSVSADELAADLRSLGLEPGAVVLVHSSLSRIGFVQGGANAVIHALLQTLGPSGTLLMPSFPFDTYVEDYLETHLEFSVTSTPSRMGSITEAFRLRQGVRRSMHPTHPVAALGPAAADLTSTHHKETKTFGTHSPFYKLCELQGSILLLGVDFHSMTNLHVVEDTFDAFPYEVYSQRTFATRMRDAHGGEIVFQCRAHSKTLSSLRDCNKMESYFSEAGALVRGQVGDAVARLMPAAAVLRVMRDLAARGITMYDDERVPDSHRRHGARLPSKPAR